MDLRKIFPEKELRKFIFIFYIVGILGMGIPYTRPVFIRLIPLQFLVNLVILWLGDRTANPRLFLVSAIAFITGYLVEVAGVNTGTLFGLYAYGSNMGPELFNTPLVIGISWLVMIYMTVTIAQQFTMHPVYRTVLAAVLMTVFDFLLEPVAMWLNMWHWHGGNVPLMNYIMWFLVSLLLASLFPILRIRIRNRVAPILFAVLVAFFLILLGISFVEKLIG